MATPTANPTPKPAPWAAIRADDQEGLSRGLCDPRTAGTALLVWFRLCLEAGKAGARQVTLSRGHLAYGTHLSRQAVGLRLHDLEHLGYITITPSTVTRTNKDGAAVEIHKDRATYTLLKGVIPCKETLHPPVRLPRSLDLTPILLDSLESLKEEPPRVNTRSAPKGLVTADQVGELYGLYPRKTGKGPALKAIAKALRSAPFETLREAVSAYAAAVDQWPKAERQFIPHPATWFNGQRWEDDRETWKRSERQDRPRTAATIKAPADDYSQIKMEVLS